MEVANIEDINHEIVRLKREIIQETNCTPKDKVLLANLYKRLNFLEKSNQGNLLTIKHR